jgi:hypothetical protein
MRRGERRRVWIVTKKGERDPSHEGCLASSIPRYRDGGGRREGITIKPRVWQQETLSQMSDQRLVILTIGDSPHLHGSLGKTEPSRLLNKVDNKMHLVEHRVDDALEGTKSIISLIESLEFLCSNLPLCREPFVKKMMAVGSLKSRGGEISGKGCSGGRVTCIRDAMIRQWNSSILTCLFRR